MPAITVAIWRSLRSRGWPRWALWRYLDLATLEWSDNPPGAPESYRQTGAYLLDPANGNLVSHNIGLFVNYGAHLLWEDVPIGSDLAKAAFEALPERLAREVEEEWAR